MELEVTSKTTVRAGYRENCCHPVKLTDLAVCQVPFRSLTADNNPNGSYHWSLIGVNGRPLAGRLAITSVQVAPRSLEIRIASLRAAGCTVSAATTISPAAS